MTKMSLTLLHAKRETHLLLEVLSNLVIYLELLLNSFEFLFINFTALDGFLRRSLGWAEEIEE